MEIIRKRDPLLLHRANLRDYGATCRTFSWDKVRHELDGLPDGGLNIAYEAVDRHVAHGYGDKRALTWLSKDGGRRDFSYAALATASSRFANVLSGLGLGRGDAVFSLMGRRPELYIAALGVWKNGSVFSPLFSAFGPEPLQARMTIGRARALITTDALYARKVAAWRHELPELHQVLLVRTTEQPLPPDTVDLTVALTEAPEAFEIARTAPEDRALLHFTSGTTGRPKGAIHVHEAAVAHYITGRYALDLHADDIYWCTADPGWVTGTSYGIIAPLTNGATMIVDEAEFDVERWYGIIQDQKVTVWYTAPTAIRMLMRAGKESPKGSTCRASGFSPASANH